jgi:hypothetical protein
MGDLWRLMYSMKRGRRRPPGTQFSAQSGKVGSTHPTAQALPITLVKLNAKVRAAAFSAPGSVIMERAPEGSPAAVVLHLDRRTKDLDSFIENVHHSSWG